MSFFPISRWERDDKDFILHTIQYYHDAVFYSWDILKGMLWISRGKQKVFEMKIAIWQLWGKYQRKNFFWDGKPLLYWEMKMMMVLKLRVKIKIWWQWCWIYIWVGPPVDARADEGDELVASLVDDKAADWQEKKDLL